MKNYRFYTKLTQSFPNREPQVTLIGPFEFKASNDQKARKMTKEYLEQAQNRWRPATSAYEFEKLIRVDREEKTTTLAL